MENYTELNVQLVEQFGNLERICNQIYDTHHGVTSYMNDMERLSSAASYKISNWDYDLSRLRNIRHKRNRLSHGEVSFNELWASSDDVNYAIAFKKRILSQTDPLSMYFQSLRQIKRPDNHYQSDKPYIPVNPSPSLRQRSGYIYLLVILAIIVLIACAVFAFWGTNSF